MKKRVYFKNLSELGDLALEATIDEYQLLPVLFLCQNVFKQIYLTVLVGYQNELEWILTPLSMEQLGWLIEDQIDIRSIFLSNETVYQIKKPKNQGLEIETFSSHSVDPTIIPESGVYFEIKENDPELYQNLLQKIKEPISFNEAPSFE